MSLADILILAVLVLVAALAVRAAVRRKKRGGCSCGCDGCGRSCAGRKDNRGGDNVPDGTGKT